MTWLQTKTGTLKVIRRKSRLMALGGKIRWVWYIQNEDGIIISPHYHKKSDATNAAQKSTY